MKKWLITGSILVGNLLLVIMCGVTGFRLSDVGADSSEAKVVLWKHYMFTFYLGIAMVLPSILVFDLWAIPSRKGQKTTGAS